MTDEIVVREESIGVVMPVASADEMHNAMVAYQQLKEAVLDKTDMQDAGRGQTFVKKSGWAKLAIAFGVSTAIKQDYPKMFYRDDGVLIRAEFVIIATAPNGRFAEGWGSCSASEGRFRNNAQKIEHDLPATAETRARNRAYAALFGHGEVSYEEVKLLGVDDEPVDAEIIPKRREESQSKRAIPVNTETGEVFDLEAYRTEVRAAVVTVAQAENREASEVFALAAKELSIPTRKGGFAAFNRDELTKVLGWCNSRLEI